MGTLNRKAAVTADAEFAAITAESLIVLTPTPDDFDLASQFLHHRGISLRAGDALYLAIASNIRATAIYSLDRKLLTAGRRLGLKARMGIRMPR